MRIEDANLSLKQGLYKLYLFKALKEGIELKDIKENLNGHLNEESIGAGYRNLVRDYIKEGLVEVFDKKYQLTNKGHFALEDLSQNLLKHAENFNNVPTPKLNIDNKLISRFNFKDYELDIKRYYSLNNNLNDRLENLYEESQNNFKKEILTSLIFSDTQKVKFLRNNATFNYTEAITKIVSPNVITYFNQSLFDRNYKLLFTCIWFLRLCVLCLCISTFGVNASLQAMKAIVISFFGGRFFQSLIANYPKVSRSFSSLNASFSFFILCGFYLLNTNTGLNHQHIKLIDLLLCTVISLSAIVFYFNNFKLKGMSFLHKLVDKYTRYKVPAITFFIGFAALFSHITYQMFTIQFANIIALFSIVPFFIGTDLFEHFENSQAATLDIHNK